MVVSSKDNSIANANGGGGGGGGAGRIGVNNNNNNNNGGVGGNEGSNTNNNDNTDFCSPRGFSMGTWFGCPIRVHYTYFLVVLLSVIVSLRYASVKVTLYELIVMGPILFITILVHEFGHIKTSEKLGGQAVEIIMWPLGGLAVSSSPNPATPQSMLLVAAGGPATHIIQIVLWFGLAMLFRILNHDAGWILDYDLIKNGTFGDFLIMICLGSMYLNVALLLFNLLIPAYPLDGGQIFASSLLICGLQASTAALVTSIVGMTLAALLALWGLFSLFVTSNPFSIMTILIGLWIFKSSWDLFQLQKNGHVLSHPLFRTAAPQNNNNNNTNSNSNNV